MPDVIIIGAGAAGLLCAISAAQLGKNVLVLEHGHRAGRKILISGGGRCNFTNLDITPEKYLGANPHFCKSALAQYTQWDFLYLVNQYNIAYHEKQSGQLFCNESAKSIVHMLLRECEQAGVVIHYKTQIIDITQSAPGYQITLTDQKFTAASLVVATGGLSMPKLGATPFAYQLAKQFKLPILPTRAGLVPFTLQPDLKASLSALSGIAVPITASTQQACFQDDLLITHRGLSGPAILQISSYWEHSEPVNITLLNPNTLHQQWEHALLKAPNQNLATFLASLLPKRLAHTLPNLFEIPSIPIKQLSMKARLQLFEQLTNWQIKPAGTEGYRTAEVTLGGVNTDCINAKTMEVKTQPGLYFIGESLDVTGWLGGYNFQWAWSSGWVAGQNA